MLDWLGGHVEHRRGEVPILISDSYTHIPTILGYALWGRNILLF